MNTLQACPLNPTPAPSGGQQTQLLQDFSERFLPAIRDVVEFAKRLPGFALLAEDDKVTLLKPGVFEVLLVRLASMFDSQVIPISGFRLPVAALRHPAPAAFLMDLFFLFHFIFTCSNSCSNFHQIFNRSVLKLNMK